MSRRYRICLLSRNDSDFSRTPRFVNRRAIFFFGFGYPPSFPSFLFASFFPPSFLSPAYTACRRWVSCIGEGEKGEQGTRLPRHERGERENEKRSTRVINFHEGRVARALRAVFVPQENYRLSADSSESSTCFKLPVRRVVPAA